MSVLFSASFLEAESERAPSCLGRFLQVERVSCLPVFQSFVFPPLRLSLFFSLFRLFFAVFSS